MAFGSGPSVEAVWAFLAATDGGARTHPTLKKLKSRTGSLLRVRLDVAQHRRSLFVRAEYPTESNPQLIVRDWACLVGFVSVASGITVAGAIEKERSSLPATAETGRPAA